MKEKVALLLFAAKSGQLCAANMISLNVYVPCHCLCTVDLSNSLSFDNDKPC
jgi:hypothetical protein